MNTDLISIRFAEKMSHHHNVKYIHTLNSSLQLVCVWYTQMDPYVTNTMIFTSFIFLYETDHLLQTFFVLHSVIFGERDSTNNSHREPTCL